MRLLKKAKKKKKHPGKKLEKGVVNPFFIENNPAPCAANRAKGLFVSSLAKKRSFFDKLYLLL